MQVCKEAVATAVVYAIHAAAASDSQLVARDASRLTTRTKTPRTPKTTTRSEGKLA